MTKRVAALAILLASSLLFPQISSAEESLTPDMRLKALNVTLFDASAPPANYVKAVRSGRYLYLAGHLPQHEDGSLEKGKLGKNYSIEKGYAAAKLAAINMIATIKRETGDLSKVSRIIKLTGMVNSTDSFIDQPKVINGASDLLVSAFGDAVGKHTRIAVGMVSLPFGVPVEIEAIVELKSE